MNSSSAENADAHAIDAANRSPNVAPLMHSVDVIEVARGCPHLQLCRRLTTTGDHEYGWMTYSLSPHPVFFNIERLGYENAFQQALKARAKRQSLDVHITPPALPSSVFDFLYVKKGKGKLWLYRFNEQLAWPALRLVAPRLGASFHWEARDKDGKQSFSILRYGYDDAFQRAARAASLVQLHERLSPPKAPSELKLRTEPDVEGLVRGEVGRHALMRFNVSLREYGIALRADSGRHYWINRDTGKRLVFAGQGVHANFQQALSQRYAPDQPPEVALPVLPPSLEAALIAQTPPRTRYRSTGPAWYIQLNKDLGLHWLKLRRYSSGHYFWLVILPSATKLGTQSICVRRHGYEGAFQRAVEAWANARRIEPPNIEPPPCPEPFKDYLKKNAFSGAKRVAAETRSFNEALPTRHVRLCYQKKTGGRTFRWVVPTALRHQKTRASFSISRYGFLGALALAVQRHNELTNDQLKIVKADLPTYPKAIADHIKDHDTHAHRVNQELATLNTNPAKIALYHHKHGYWYVITQPRVAGEKAIRHSLRGRSYSKEFATLVKLRNQQGIGPVKKYRAPKVPALLKPYLRDNKALPEVPN